MMTGAERAGNTKQRHATARPPSASSTMSVRAHHARRPPPEREVLQIFVRQSAMMLERVSGGRPGALGTAAHTLIGSASGIGAWRVAAAAERLERASREGGDEDIGEAIADLKAASLEATAAIGARLAEPSH